jgi:hypothetical protein
MFGTSVGSHAGEQTTGNANTAIGSYAIAGTASGGENTALGSQVLRRLTTGEQNTASGVFALTNADTGSYNVAVGFSAGNNVTSGANNILIGSQVETPTPSTSNFLNIGDTIFGKTDTGFVGIGTTSPSAKLDVNGSVAIKGRLSQSVTANANALSAITADFSASNMIRASGSALACGTLNFTNVVAGGSYTITIPNATATCSTVQLNGSTTNVKLPSGYAGATAVSGAVYTAIYDGTTLWVSAVPF